MEKLSRGLIMQAPPKDTEEKEDNPWWECAMFWPRFKQGSCRIETKSVASWTDCVESFVKWLWLTCDLDASPQVEIRELRAVPHNDPESTILNCMTVRQVQILKQQPPGWLWARRYADAGYPCAPWNKQNPMLSQQDWLKTSSGIRALRQSSKWVFCRKLPAFYIPRGGDHYKIFVSLVGLLVEVRS